MTAGRVETDYELAEAYSATAREAGDLVGAAALLAFAKVLRARAQETYDDDKTDPVIYVVCLECSKRQIRR